MTEPYFFFNWLESATFWKQEGNLKVIDQPPLSTDESLSVEKNRLFAGSKKVSFMEAKEEKPKSCELRA